VKQVLNRRVRNFASCAERVLPGSAAFDDEDFGIGRLYCAIAPAWFMSRDADRLGAELQETIGRLPLNQFFGSGMHAITEFSVDERAARLLLMELTCTLKYLGVSEPARAGLAHLQDVANRDGRGFIVAGVADLLSMGWLTC